MTIGLILMITLAIVVGGFAFFLSTRQEVRDILFSGDKLKITLATGADLSEVEVPVEHIKQIHTVGWNIGTVYIEVIGSYPELEKYKSGTTTYTITIQGFSISNAQEELYKLVCAKPTIVRDDTTKSVFDRIARKLE